MKFGLGSVILVVLVLCLMFWGCATATETTEVEADPQEVVVDTPSSTITPESVPPQTTITESQQTDVTPVSSEPLAVDASTAVASLQPNSTPPQPTLVDPGKTTVEALSSPSADGVPKQPIQVSQEVFTRTFSEVEQVIDTLNKLIQQRNYGAWLEWLSEAYQTYTVSPEQLVIVNNSATLKRNGQVVRNLSDYFMFVVVPSRANLRLDDLVFLSENEVEAIMKVGDRRVTVYRLIKIGDRWKIGLSL